MALERVETFLWTVVIVCGQCSRMRVESEGTQGTGEPGKLDVQLLGMEAPHLRDMAQRRQARVDGVQQPEARDFLSRELFGVTATTPRHGFALRVENLDQALQQLHQSLARPDLHTRRHILGVVHEVAGAVASNARDRQ